MLDSASFCGPDKRHAEDVLYPVVENTCGSFASLVRKVEPLVQGNGRFVRSKDLEFNASQAGCLSRVDRLVEKLAPDATPAETNEQPHTEYARVPKAFALVRRDVTPADDFISLYGYKLNRRILAEKGVHVLQRRRLEKSQPPSLPRDRIKTPPEALRVLRGASSHGHVGELVRRRDSPFAPCNGWALSYGRPCYSQVSTGGRPGSTANWADAGPGRPRGNQSGRTSAAAPWSGGRLYGHAVRYEKTLGPTRVDGGACALERREAKYCTPKISARKAGSP